MSIRATAWAWTVPASPTAKLVLLALADFADEIGHCWPAVARIVEMTGLSERAVRGAITSLEASGALAMNRGGNGRGHSSRYRLRINEPLERVQEMHPNACEKGAAGAERVHVVPERVQHVPERVQELHHVEPPRTIKNRQEPPTQGRAAAPSIALPEWLPASAWSDYCRHREALGKRAWTQRAAELSIRDLGKLHDQGNDPQAVIEQSIANGWRGLFPIKGQRPAQQREGKTDWIIRSMMEDR